MRTISNMEMKTTVSRSDLLDKLRENRALHADIVKEARNGYIASAKRELESRLNALSSGKVVSLLFRLEVPQDHTETYNTAIEMMEWSQEETVALTAEEFTNLVRDKWAWTEQFYASNKRYSPTASSIADELGV